MRKMQARILMAAVAGPLLLVTSAVTAHADVTVGQSMRPSNYNCGSNERTTGDETIIIAGVPVKQKAMIYRNCGGVSVKRRADVIADADGRCMTIGAGRAIVIHQVFVLPFRTAYRSSKVC